MTTPAIGLLQLRRIINEELEQVNEAKLGQRVKIVTRSGDPFNGLTGEVVNDQDRDGRTKMYRVRLDDYVAIPGVGMVRDDLWAGQYLKPIREALDHKSINSIVGVASKLLAAVEGFKEKAPPAAINAVVPHIDQLARVLEDMVSTPGSYVAVPKKEPKKVTLKAQREARLREAEEFSELTDEQVSTLMEKPLLKRYLEREYEFTGNIRDAITNSLAVFTDDDGHLHVTDVDGVVFDYVWNGPWGRWNKLKHRLGER